MVQTVITIAAVITALSVIGGFFYALHKVLNRFEAIEESGKHRKQESKVLFTSVVAIFGGFEQLGCNGPVTKAKEELQKFLIERGD